MSGVKLFKAPNRLAEAVDVRFGLKLDAALSRAQASVTQAQDGMLKSLHEWVDEIEALCDQPAPDRARLSWLANGVHSIAGACELTALSRCGGLFGHAVEMMGEAGWRSDLVQIYATTMGRMLERADGAAQEAAILSSLEAMNQRVFGADL